MEPKKILVLDHSNLMRKMYELMLRRYPLGYAGDSREAIDRLNQHLDIDLVLIDLNFPGLDEMENMIESGFPDREVRPRVIVVSTEGREEDAARVLQRGAHAAIRKPFHAEELLATIDGIQ